MVTVALVGRRAGSFVAGLASVPGTRIVAVCELDPERCAQLAARAGLEGAGTQFDSYDDLLDRARPDAVVLGTPMPLHVPQAVQALEAGIHALSEVTAAVSMEQCEQLVAAAERAEQASGARYMMAENYCYGKEVVLVRALARAGRFGKCYFAEGEYVHDVKHLHQKEDGTPTWRATWQVGKRGCTYGTHSLGPALEFFGPEARVVSVSCVGTGAHTNPKHANDDTSLMLCQLNTGGLIKVRLDMMSNRPHAMTYYSLQGTAGSYEAGRGFGAVPKIWLDESTTEVPTSHNQRQWRSLWDYETDLPEMWRSASEEAIRAGHGGGDFFVARDFIHAIAAGTRPPIDIYRAMDYTVPGILSEQSIAQGGAPIPVPDFRDRAAAAQTTATPAAVGAAGHAG